jgi:hypothetical protein
MSERVINPYACESCGSIDSIDVTMQVRRTGKVFFKVDCEQCGRFSHFLKRGPREIAIEQYLRELKRLPVRNAVTESDRAAMAAWFIRQCGSPAEARRVFEQEVS